MFYHTNYNGKFRHFVGGTPGALRHRPPCPQIRAVHVLSVIAVLAISTGILLAAQSGCSGAYPAGADGSYDTSDMGPFEHAPVQATTEEGGMPNLTAACQIADTLADMLFTGVLDTAYAVHGVLSLTAADNVTADSTLKLDRASGIVTFESGGHTYAAVAAFHDHSVQILNITNPYNITAAGNIADTATYQYNDTLELIGASGIATFESGGHTYAAVTAYRDDSVQILNITDPFNIIATDSITDTDTLELYTPYGIATFELDGHTYAAVTAYDDDGVQILNITDPFNIIATDSITDTDTLELRGARSLTTFNTGGHIYAAVAARSDDGVQILNITDPFNITAADSITDTNTLELHGARDITTFESGGYTYAAVTAYTDDGVQILNITNPYNITAADSITDAGTLELYAANGIAIFNAGSHIYAAVAASVDDGVQILDITDPSDITAAASITNGDNLRLDAPYGIATFESGGHTYVVVTTSLDNSVQIIRIDPAVPDTTISDTAPTVTSIERYSPSSATTGSQTLTYKVTFSEDVTGVGTADFALSSDSTGETNGNNPVASISGSGSVYYAEVSASTDGTYNLDLVSSGHGIADTASNPLTNTAPTGADETYTVNTVVTDTTAPTISSITRYSPSSATTDSQTLTYKVTFSEDVTGVGTADFALSSDSTGETNGNNPVASISGSGSVYYAEVSASTDGTYNLDLVSSGHGIADTASNPLTNTAPTGADETYTVNTVVTDTTAPTISSITRYSPSSATTDSQTLTYKVTFSEDVTGVGTADFALSSGSTGGTSTSSGQFTQTRSPSLAIPDNTTVSDAITVADSGTATSVTVAVVITHTYIGDLRIDLVAPDGTTKTLHNRSGGSIDDINQEYTPDFEGVPIAGTWSLRISDNANSDSGTLNDWTLTINHGSSTASPVTSISGSSDTYYATVSSTQAGTYNLDLVSSGHGIADESSNPLTSTTPTGADETYTVSTTITDTTAPTISSIERYSPSSATTDSQTLVYEVTFSEDVTGVDKSDFALSSGSTGGTSTGSGQFTQTSSPSLAITQANTISDTITVSDSGTATSVSVAVDVTHTYIGDLKIDLVAPDGTTKTVHSRSGGGTDDIDQTYTPDFEGESIAGTWTLRINDNYAAADDGTLNSWTLTINHGSGTTTNPVTSISGSGDTYYVTVSSTQDGTYNLDLVSSGHGIADESSNPLTDTTPTGADETYTVSTTITDTTAPTISSIERYSPSSATTDSQTLVYRITFSEDVTGVGTADFALSPGSTGGTSTGSGQFTQTSSPSLAITQANTISDTITVSDSGTATSVSVAVDVTHTYIGDLKIDLVAPDGTTKTVHSRSGGGTDDIDQTYTPDFEGESIAGTWTLRINDNYAAADNGILNSWTLTINHGSGTTTNPVTSISGSGDTYYVTVSSTQDGTYNLDLVSSGHGIADESSNPLANTTPTGADETYTVSTTITDTTAPTISSIERYSPSSATTDSQTLVYRITFSEDVTGVGTADFALSSGSTGGTSTGSGQFTQTRSPSLAIPDNTTVSDAITVADSGTATSVTVAVDITHTYIGDLKIELVAPDGTTKTVHSRSGGGTDDIDQTYTPDFEGESIAGTWTLRISDNANSDSGTLNSWTLTINHGSGTTTNPVTSISGSGDTYYVTVSSTQDGTYNLDLVSSGHGIADTASNPLANTTPTGADETYTVSTTITDTTAPTVSSIERYNPLTATTDSQTLVYRITFSEDVTGVGTADFALFPGSTGGTSTSSGQFTQTRSPSLAITQANTISDTITVSDSGTATSVSVAVDVTHTYIGDLKIDLVAPDGTTKTVHSRSGGGTDDIDQTYTPDFEGESIAGTWTLRINDNYAAADNGVLNSWTLTINHGSGTTTNPVTSISGSGDTYYVTVSSTQDGTYNLDLVSSGHGIADESSNPLANTTPTGADETYTVSTTITDTTAPTVSSIERYSPSSATTDSQTLVYKVTFSEDVAGVGTADFALSPGSTGGTSTSSGQFTQTSSPSLAITQANTISDTITVSDSGTATSVSVAVDVTHTYIGDLKIDLVAPDGTTKTVHSRSGGGTDDIDQTYTPDFEGESIAGTWTLRINDNYAAADNGVLNSWTLTINHGSGTTTNPVTSISGSGDTYYVTVSSTQDGTYNLDLVSSGHGIADESSNPLANTTPTGADETYTVSTTITDTTAPTISSIERYSPSSATTDSQTLVYRITFSEDVTGVGTADFVLSSDSTGNTNGNNPAASISGSGSVYYATVSASTDGTYNLDLVPSGHGIADTASNPLANTTPTGADETYTVSTTITDTTAPTVSSIERYSPSSATTDSQTLVYKVTFSEDVTGVGTADFALSSDSTGNTNGNNPVASVSGSGSVYYATVSATTDGTYNLDLVPSGHGIADESSNPLTNTTPTGADETYTVSTTVVSTTNPRLESIERYSPLSQNTNSQYLIYKATFSKSVTGVDASDFVLSPGSTGGGNNGISPVAGITSSGYTYYVIVSSAVDGTYNLDLVSSGHNIADAANNPLTNTTPTGADETYTVS